MAGLLSNLPDCEITASDICGNGRKQSDYSGADFLGSWYLEHSFDNHGCINVRVDLVSFSEILTFTLNRPVQLPENYRLAVIHSIQVYF